jgi:cell wall-associated NlpC family hydrolase
MSEEIERSAALIEHLLGDPELRRRFRADPAPVLREHGLLELAEGLGRGRRALMTLELRESRSSLAGVMVAAAAEGVDFTHIAERAAPGLEREAGRAVDRLLNPPSHHPAPAASAKPSAPAPAASAKPSIGASAEAPPLALRPAPAAAAAHRVAAASPLPQSAPTGQSGTAGGGGAAAPSPTQAGGFAAAPGQEAAQAGQGAVRAGQGAAHAGQGAAHAGQGSGGAAVQPRGHGQAPAAEHHVSGPDVHGDPLSYPGDSATPQQLAAWMGAYAQRAGLPPELPVMASLTESGLRNLNYGDRDSVGFFQMRLGIWNQGAYAGYPDHPELQMQWFIDHAVAARNEDPALAQSPSTWGEWVANVEQPAAEYRYRYQLQLGTAQELLRGADLAPAADQVVHVAVGQQAAEVAKKLVGTVYGSGGSNPGADSSGLVHDAYAREGIQLPRVAAEQFDVGIPVAREHLRPGDAVFFSDASHFVHHVGVYIGNGNFISTPEAGGHVRVFPLSDPSFSSQYAGARRYTAAALSDPSRYARSLPTIKP